MTAQEPCGPLARPTAQMPVAYSDVTGVLLADGKWYLPKDGTVRLAMQTTTGISTYRFVVDDASEGLLAYDVPAAAVQAVEHGEEGPTGGVPVV